MTIVTEKSKVRRPNDVCYAVSSEFEPINSVLERCRFPLAKDANIISPIFDLAVSGGPDSLAMTVLALAAGLRIRIWHFDHQIRDTSTLEAEWVAEFAESIGAEFSLVSHKIEAGSNLEARARKARKESFPRDIATGHTMDDQVETLLINLLRGSGTAGLSAMRIGAAKPILALRKAETSQICKVVGLNPIHDASNDSTQFLRNRIRHELVPSLNDLARRDVVPVLFRSAEIFGLESDFLDGLACDIDPTNRVQLREANLVVRYRSIRRAASQITGYPPSFDAMTQLSNLIDGSGNFRLQIAGHLDVSCVRNWIAYLKV